jgi:hypothetical protein
VDGGHVAGEKEGMKRGGECQAIVKEDGVIDVAAEVGWESVTES